MLWAGIFLLALAALIWWRRSRHLSELTVIERTPTTPCGEIKEGGYYEVTGHVRAPRPVLAPPRSLPCIRFRRVTYQTVQEPYRDPRGAYRIDTVTREVSAEEESAGFFIEDPSGKIWVAPEGARFEESVVLHQDPELTGPGTRSVVTGIPNGSRAYVIGPVAPGADGPAFRARARGKDELFLVAFGGESGVFHRRALWIRLHGISAALLALLGVSLVVSGWSPESGGRSPRLGPSGHSKYAAEGRTTDSGLRTPASGLEPGGR